MSKLEKLLPPSILRWSKSASWKRWKNKSNQQIFEEIYEKKIWGQSKHEYVPFFSGGGSHGDDVVNSYISSVKSTLSKLKKKPKIVDLGCGDFNVGQNFVAHSNTYVGCDVVSTLVEFNKAKFKRKNLSFSHLDIVNDELPSGDVAIVRQVLQHLSNSQIFHVLQKIQSNYQFLILTEHLPKKEKFIPNIDIPAGHLVRANINSGLDIDKAPFHFSFKAKTIIDETSHSGGKIQTTFYQIKD